jgi:hypothetical protein
MTDPILKKAMDKRDEALREVERWEEGSKTTWNLSELTLESLDSPKGRAKVEGSAPDSIILASTLRDPALPPPVSDGKATWPRNANGV